MRAITVTVTPVNEHDPQFTSPAMASVPENTTTVMTVTASDADRPIQTMTYSKVGGADQADFTINASTGVLSFITAPNYEAPADADLNNVYLVTVQASDGNGGTDNPADLFRAGPQLSFLAVRALMWIGNWAVRRGQQADRLDQLIAATRPWPVRAVSWIGAWIFWLLVTTIVVWITALPLVLYHFHVVSLVAVPISPTVWILVVAAMWSGFFMIALGWLIPPVGVLCGAICDFSLAWLEGLVQWAESLPAGHFWVPGPDWWWVVVFYVGLMAAIIFGRALAPPRWQLATLCVWILVGLAPALIRADGRDGLDCSFVAVGHGACVVLEAPTGETLLYDAGSLGSPEFATQTIAAYLWHRGIMRIDGIVISHRRHRSFSIGTAVTEAKIKPKTPLWASLLWRVRLSLCGE